MTNTPASFIDYVLQEHGIKNDAQLCKRLEVFPPVLSKARNNKLPFGASLILRFHEEFDIPVREIKLRAGLTKEA